MIFNSNLLSDNFDTEQVMELRDIYENGYINLFTFLSDHPEINSDCLFEINQIIRNRETTTEETINTIISVLDVYTMHILESGEKCSFDRIKYGMYAIKSGMQYPYIVYLMCTSTIPESNIVDVYECFKNNITLARITETIRIYSIYTSDQIRQICGCLTDVNSGKYDSKFIRIIKDPLNSADDMYTLRKETEKLAISLRSINTISKNLYLDVSIEEIV